MSIEENKEIARRAIEDTWNGSAEPGSFSAENWVHHTRTDQGRATDLEAWKELVTTVRSHMSPDSKMTVVDQVAEGEMVCSRFAWQLKLDTELSGFALPPGRPVTIQGVVIHCLQDGLIKDMWTYNDVADVLRRLTEG
jgi:predicted ester cyclase